VAAVGATRARFAGRHMVERMHSLLDKRKSFAFETTLAAISYSNKISQWQSIGYRVKLIFVWLPTVELAIDRVANRVSQGGHDVPPLTIRRRYRLGLANFGNLYCPIVDEWILLNGSQFPPTEIARKENGVFKVLAPDDWQRFEQQRQNLDSKESEQ